MQLPAVLRGAREPPEPAASRVMRSFLARRFLSRSEGGGAGVWCVCSAANSVPVKQSMKHSPGSGCARSRDSGILSLRYALCLGKPSL